MYLVDGEYKLVTFVNISALEGHDDTVIVHTLLDFFCHKYIQQHPSTSSRSSCEWMELNTTSIFHQIEQVKGTSLVPWNRKFNKEGREEGL